MYQFQYYILRKMVIITYYYYHYYYYPIQILNLISLDLVHWIQFVVKKE